MTKLRTAAPTIFIFLAVLPFIQCQTKDAPAAGVANPITNGSTQASVRAGSENASPNPGKTTSPTRLENAHIDAIDTDFANVSLTDCIPSQPEPSKIVCNGNVFHIKVNDASLRAKLKDFHVSDHIRVDINSSNELQNLRGAWFVPVGTTCRLLVLTVCALALLGFATAATKGAPLKFIVGLDNRYSNSKFQLALWFWIAMSSYLAAIVLRLTYAGWDFFDAVNIPQHLLLLSGMSVLTYGGAKAITTAKVNTAANPAPIATAVAAVPAAPGIAAPPAVAAAVVAPPSDPDPKNALQPGQERFFRDLLEDDNQHFDFGDFQMLVITLVAVGMYLALLLNYLGSIEFVKTTTLPDVDTTILAAFGLGQGAYLAKKAAGNVGAS